MVDAGIVAQASSENKEARNWKHPLLPKVKGQSWSNANKTAANRKGKSLSAFLSSALVPVSLLAEPAGESVGKENMSLAAYQPQHQNAQYGG